ncbi:phosphoglycerate mutase family protein [Ancylostoma duodenale]|uniref:Phosphoglycerate mutase family protein n=1 Tax=Ancylostoma duodenale TaxID=51022 RepID=A0A0C2D937_9BILA|nr:phosphoglycerate mutase family protein [Ancylostoma duodenale]
MKHPSRILWFVRHGERVDNLNKAWKLTAERWDDPPLSPRGHQQAREVGIALAAEPIDYAICSPFTRCIETVTEIFSVRKVSPLIWIEPGLGESLNVCMTPPGRPTMEQIKSV